MDPIVNPQTYPPEILRKVQTMPPLGRSIANRWMMGWPDRVKALLKAGEYLPALQAQEQAERDALAESTARHLAQHEIVQEAGLSLAPPMTLPSTARTSDAED